MVLFDTSNSSSVKSNDVFDSEVEAEATTSQTNIDTCEGNQCVENSTLNASDSTTDYSITESTPIGTEYPLVKNLTTEEKTTLPQPITTTDTNTNRNILAPATTSVSNVLTHEDGEPCFCDLTVYMFNAVVLH